MTHRSIGERPTSRVTACTGSGSSSPAGPAASSTAPVRASSRWPSADRVRSGISRSSQVSRNPTSSTGTAYWNTMVMASPNAAASRTCWSAGRWPISSGVIPAGAAPPSRSLRRWLNRAPNRATPTDPPTARKNVTVEVATPRSSTGDSFWVASTRICITMPMPAPSIAMYRPDSHRLLPVSSVDSRYMARLARAIPMIGNFR
jgi:hypothetical protein